MKSDLLLSMQAVDDRQWAAGGWIEWFACRESRLRSALTSIQAPGGRLRGADIRRLVLVSRPVLPQDFLPMCAQLCVHSRPFPDPRLHAAHRGGGRGAARRPRAGHRGDLSHGGHHRGPAPTVPPVLPFHPPLHVFRCSQASGPIPRCKWLQQRPEIAIQLTGRGAKKSEEFV
jgi:hypothetical protein